MTDEKREIELLSLIANSVMFLRKYFWIILIFLTLGLTFGAVDYFYGRNYYRTNLIASSPVVNNQIIYEIAEPIKYFLKNEMYDSVAKQIGIDVTTAQSIREIKLDTSINQAVVITLDLYNKEDISVIQDGLIQYFNEIPYIKSTIVKRRLELENYIKLLDQEIKDLNEMQVAVLNSIFKENSQKMVSAGGLFNEIVILYEKKIELEQEYNSLKSFTLINNNLVFITQKSLKKNLMIYGLVGLFFGILLSGVLDISRSVRKKLKP